MRKNQNQLIRTLIKSISNIYKDYCSRAFHITLTINGTDNPEPFKHYFQILALNTKKEFPKYSNCIDELFSISDEKIEKLLEDTNKINNGESDSSIIELSRNFIKNLGNDYASIVYDTFNINDNSDKEFLLNLIGLILDVSFYLYVSIMLVRQDLIKILQDKELTENDIIEYLKKHNRYELVDNFINKAKSYTTNRIDIDNFIDILIDEIVKQAIKDEFDYFCLIHIIDSIMENLLINMLRLTNVYGIVDIRGDINTLAKLYDNFSIN